MRARGLVFYMYMYVRSASSAAVNSECIHDMYSIHACTCTCNNYRTVYCVLVSVCNCILLSLDLPLPLTLPSSLPLILISLSHPLIYLSQHMHPFIHVYMWLPPSLSPPSSTPFFTLQVRTYVRTVRES